MTKSLTAAVHHCCCRLGRLSVAARVTSCLVVGLWLVLLSVWMAYAWNPRYVPWPAYLSWSRGGVLVVLIAGVAFAAYGTVRAWLADDLVDRSISSAWARGLQELSYHGLPIDALPIHLILGAGLGEDEERLIRASGDYRFVLPSGGASGLTFFANSSRLCLSAGGVGLTALVRTALGPKIREWSPDQGTSCFERYGLASDVIQEESSDLDPLLQTLVAVGWESRQENDNPESADDDDHTSGMACKVLSPTATIAMRTIPQPLALIRDPLEVETAPLWSFAEAAEAGRKLCQLASLIRSARRPLCPINRTIIVVPIAILLHESERIPELQLAIRRDLEILHQTLQLNAPVTVLISGLENHPGFVEFMRRAGPQVLQQQALGQAVEVGSPTTREQLNALAVNACGQVEDCIYAMLQKEAALSSPGNTSLYRLLCDLRTGIRKSLSDLLMGAFASVGVGASEQSIAGCYFCASGSQPQQRGFVEAVWRLQDRGQEELDWSPEALQRELIHRGLCRAGWVATAGLMLTWIGLMRTWWVH